jgi:hypothetical protein
MKPDEDDDTQVYTDTLLIVYQRGFADGKRSAQRKPLTDEQIDAGVAAWFATETVVGGRPFEKRMRAAIEAAHNIKEGT